MTIRIRLPGGTLKIKKKDELRRREQKRQVPVWRTPAKLMIPSLRPDRSGTGPGNSRRNNQRSALDTSATEAL
ncbi:MAG: hypothetical protein E5Y81_16405 [Mesorhizobium sp.]|nr:MAG: hypothetical protein E5Y81_16405 [Mesorhizobium sp.]